MKSIKENEGQYRILERTQETWTMAGLGTRFAIERAEIGNSRHKVARACVLLDPTRALTRRREQVPTAWRVGEDPARSQGLG